MKKIARVIGVVLIVAQIVTIAALAGQLDESLISVDENGNVFFEDANEPSNRHHYCSEKNPPVSCVFRPYEYNSSWHWRICMNCPNKQEGTHVWQLLPGSVTRVRCTVCGLIMG